MQRCQACIFLFYETQWDLFNVGICWNMCLTGLRFMIGGVPSDDSSCRGSVNEVAKTRDCNSLLPGLESWL